MNIPVVEEYCASDQVSNEKPELPTIYEKHYQSLYQNVFLITKCEQTSEDIVHDVFINFWIRKEKLGEIKDIHAYLFLMSRNFAFDYLRRKKVEQKVLKDLVETSSKESPDDKYVEKEFKITCDEAIAKLPLRQKLIYNLKREEAWSKQRIAKQLNISPCTVKATMQNALRSVKKYVVNKYRDK